MDHQEFFLAAFRSHDLESDSLQIISEEYNSLVDRTIHRLAMMLDELKAAPLDDVE